MPRGQDTRGDPRRSVTSDRFAIGQPQRWSGYGSNVKAPQRTTITRRGGNFGQGPPLQKNESGRGYHVSGAPGYERGDRAVDFYNKVTKDRR